jgi:hypothetical protein
LLGAALFHCGPPQWPAARAAFAAAVAAKDACGAAAATPAATPADAAAASGMVETLLFLAKLQWELRQPAEAEATHGRALTVGRTRLGDAAPATKKALMAMVELSGKRKQLAEALARAQG